MTDICELMTKLTEDLANDIDRVSVDYAGKVVDMIKDLAEAQYYICKCKSNCESVSTSDSENSETDVEQMLTDIRIIWRESDVDARRKLKADFVKLVNEMNV